MHLLHRLFTVQIILFVSPHCKLPTFKDVYSLKFHGNNFFIILYIFHVYIYSSILSFSFACFALCRYAFCLWDPPMFMHLMVVCSFYLLAIDESLDGFQSLLVLWIILLWKFLQCVCTWVWVLLGNLLIYYWQYWTIE